MQCTVYFFTECPAPRTIRYNCVRFSRRVDTIYFVIKNNSCHRRRITRRERCGCPKRRIWRFCDSKTGARVRCRIVFRLNQRRRPYFCQKFKRCHSRRLRCPVRRVIRKKCNEKTGKRIVYTIYYIKKRHICRCVKKVKRRLEVCCEYYF